MFNNRFTSSNRKLFGYAKKVRFITDVLFWAYKAKVVASMFYERLSDLS